MSDGKITFYENAPWGGATGEGDIFVWGVDWSGAAFRWCFGSPDDLVADFVLTNAAAGSEGISATFDDYVDPETGESGAATRIRPQIDASRFEQTGTEDISLKHTLYVTPSGEPERVIWNGEAVIEQTVEEAL